METQLQRIAKVAKSKPKERFTSLIHLVNKETLIECHNNMNGNKASGIDEMTKEEYGMTKNIVSVNHSKKQLCL